MLQALSLKLVGHFRPNSCPSMTPHCLWPCFGGCLVVHRTTSRGPCGRSQREQTIHQSELSGIKFCQRIREFELFERRRPDALGPSHMLLAHAPTWQCPHIYEHSGEHAQALTCANSCCNACLPSRVLELAREKFEKVKCSSLFKFNYLLYFLRKKYLFLWCCFSMLPLLLHALH